MNGREVAGSPVQVDAAGAPDVKVTWVGHATVLVEVAGFRVLTDPALTPRLAHLVRHVPSPDLGRIDVVLLSHIHADHLHRRSLRRVAEGARVVLPAGGDALVGGLGATSVDGVRPGDQVHLGADAAGGDVTAEVVHADHSCRRGPHTRHSADPVGFVIRAGGRAIYFAGDTGLFDGMGDGWGDLDVALLPIWGWGRTLGTHHLDPRTAVTATKLVEPRHVVPIHWGTYSPLRPGRGAPGWLERPLEQFRHHLAEAGLVHRLRELRPGGSMVVEGPEAAAGTSPGGAAGQGSTAA